jgi:UDP-glucose 4-epimerase
METLVKRIIVTGGNGYVGRELVRLLAPANEVCVVDNLASGPSRFGPEERNTFRFAEVDITDEDAVSKLFGEIRPDIVVHLAAVHFIPQCERDPVHAIRTNVLGTMTVLRSAPEGSRVVFASSGAVYKPDSQPHAETSIQQPSDVYGLTKLHGEHYVANVAAARGLGAVVVRLFNVVGPGETNPHLFPELVAQLKAGRRVVRLGNLWPKRDYIHVKDAARGFAAVAVAPDIAAGEVFTVNLGTSMASSVSEVVDKLRAISQVRFEIEADDSRARKVDRPFLSADTARIRERFGWTPEFTVDDAMADLWRDPQLTSSLSAQYQ